MSFSKTWFAQTLFPNRVPSLYRSLPIPNYITRQKCGVKWCVNEMLKYQIQTCGLPLVHATEITTIYDFENGKRSWKTEKFFNKKSKKLCRYEVKLSNLIDISKPFQNFWYWNSFYINLDVIIRTTVAHFGFKTLQNVWDPLF